MILPPSADKRIFDAMHRGDYFDFALQNARREFGCLCQYQECSTGCVCGCHTQKQEHPMSTIEATALIALSAKYPGLVKLQTLDVAMATLRVAA